MLKNCAFLTVFMRSLLCDLINLNYALNVKLFKEIHNNFSKISAKVQFLRIEDLLSVNYTNLGHYTFIYTFPMLKRNIYVLNINHHCSHISI